MANYIQVRLKPEDIEKINSLSGHVSQATGNGTPSRADIIRFIINKYHLEHNDA